MSRPMHGQGLATTGVQPNLNKVVFVQHLAARCGYTLPLRTHPTPTATNIRYIQTDLT
jgi:hypothetical protein